MACSRFGPATLAQPDLRLPIDAVGRLDLRSPDGVALCVEAADATVLIDVASLADLRRLARDLPGRAGRREWLRRTAGVARCGGFEFALRVRRREVARLRAEGRGSWLATLLGMAPLELSLPRLIRCAFPG
jgi:hypothetical protein